MLTCTEHQTERAHGSGQHRDQGCGAQAVRKIRRLRIHGGLKRAASFCRRVCRDVLRVFQFPSKTILRRTQDRSGNGLNRIHLFETPE